MPKKGENIYKRKDGRWEGRYIKGRNGKKIIYGYVYAKSYSEAKSFLSMKQAEYVVEEKQKQTVCIGEKEQKNLISAKSVPLFEELAELWLASIKSSVKESTWIKYRNTLRCNVVPLLGNLQLCEIDYFQLSTFCSFLLENGGRANTGLSSKSVSDALFLIKSVLRYASRLKYQTDCTAFDVSVKVKKGTLRVLSIQEEQRLLSALANESDLTALGILICLFTGIRLGELCALTWEDISLETNIIHIHRTMQRLQTSSGHPKTSILIAEPKSQSSIRDIPIPEALGQRLAAQPVREGYVLTGSCCKYVEPRTMQNRFQAIATSCQLSDMHFHCLRHTFATRCIEVGFDVKSLSEILGHANVSITLNRYVHPSMELKQRNMDKLSALLAVK